MEPNKLCLMYVLKTVTTRLLLAEKEGVGEFFLQRRENYRAKITYFLNERLQKLEHGGGGGVRDVNGFRNSTPIHAICFYTCLEFAQIDCTLSTIFKN